MRLLAKFFLLIFLLPAGFISSCVTQTQLNSDKIHYLPRTMYMVQTQDQRWGRELYYLVPVPDKTSKWKKSNSTLFHHKIPDLQDYEDAKTLWQSWQGTEQFTQSRIIGVIPSQTPFQMQKTTSAAFWPYDIQIKLLQGPFQERKVNAEYSVLQPRRNR